MRRIRGVVLFAIVASAIVAAPLAQAGRGKQVPRATARVQSKRDDDQPTRRPSLASAIGATRANLAARAPAAKAAARERAQSGVDIAWEGTKGAAIDGPRHTYRAIRKNPVKFAAGVFAIGAIGALGRWFGFDGGTVAVVLSAGAVTAQVSLAWPKLKKARGRDLARRMGADVIWPAALFFGSWGLGHEIVGDHLPDTPPGPSDLATSFVSSAVIGGDAPAVAVTALDTARGGDGIASR